MRGQTLDGFRPAPLRIAYFSPLSPERSGIADYSEELLPHLAPSARVTLFASVPEMVSGRLQAAFEVRPIADYGAARWQYDIALYHMGDSLFHEAIYGTLLRYPGITVLHDHGLHHFMTTRTIPRGNFAGYAREMGYALGTEGVGLAYRIRSGRAEHPLYTVPLNERVLDRSMGLIVHSEYAERRIKSVRPGVPVAVVPAPICVDHGPLRSRRELGCSENTLLFVSAGQVITTKQVTLALGAFARLLPDFPHALFAVIGEEPQDDLDLHSWLQQRGLGDAVLCTGYLADIRDFVSWIAASDVMVNLRSPTVGETSATALRGLAAGRPVIVSNHGWYSELPDDACVKVTPGDGESLYQAMRRLAGSPELRREIGQRAAEHTRREHSPAGAAQKYLDFIGSMVARATGKLAQGAL
jgi:glycosyltransferase involved in cell wall biosynthesis